MTTPQNELYNIRCKLNDLSRMLGLYLDEDDNRECIYDMVKSIEIETTEFNERMQLLEDKMNLIIKLLIKDEKKNI